MKKISNVLLISVILLALLITSCGPADEKPRDQGIQLESWKYALVTLGQNATMSFAENAKIKTMDGQEILPEAIAPGQTVIVENLDDDKLAVFAIIQDEGSTTIVKLVKPGNKKCPEWAGNLFDNGCESEELPIIGDKDN